MKIIFFGTPDFAVETLSKICENNYKVIAVVTAPDKPAGRGQQLHFSAVKQFALKSNLPLLQPTNLKDDFFIRELENLKPDLQIVVAFRMLPEKVWNLPPLGTINLHGSLLPQYRGAAPINWALINGEKTTGVTTFLLKHEIDTGNILLQKKVEISDEDNFESLYNKLKVIGGNLIIETLIQLQNSKITPTPQDSITTSQIKHAPKLTKDLGRIDVQVEVTYNHNLVRGLSPIPGAYYEFTHSDGKNQILKLFKTSVELDNNATLGILSDGKSYLKIGCKNGYLQIHELQLQGKKRMQVVEFLRGFRI